MKQRSKLVAYLVFMTLLISGTLFLASSADRSNCPVCNHSIVAEGMLIHSPITIK